MKKFIKIVNWILVGSLGRKSLITIKLSSLGMDQCLCLGSTMTSLTDTSMKQKKDSTRLMMTLTIFIVTVKMKKVNKVTDMKRQTGVSLISLRQKSIQRETSNQL